MIEMTVAPSIVMNVEQVCELMGGCSEDTIRNLIREEGFPYRPIKGKLLFILPEVEKWIMSQPMQLSKRGGYRERR